MSYAVLMIACLSLFIFSGLLIYYIELKRANKREREFIKLEPELEPVRKPATNSKPNSLMPGNQSLGTKKEVAAKGHLVGTLEYKFFGSVLLINNQQIIKGLPKQNHSVEITETELFIDNKQYQVHSDVIKMIRNHIAR